LIRHNYTWPELKAFVIDYVQSCNTCICNKARYHKPYKLLKQLPIPPQLWKSISMDFIEYLPASEGYTDILVVVDQLTKQAIFISTHKMLDIKELAKLFITYVFSKHGVPSHVTSDHRSEFTSRFFHSLTTVLSMKLHFTSGYHPEAVSQMATY